MAKKNYTWTVDVELDQGGRVDSTQGLDKGLPLILKVFREANVKALFFINTEIMEFRPGVIQDIINEGHEIGLHGHFHTCYKEPWRAYQNMNIARTLLQGLMNQDFFYMRAPKFSYIFPDQVYSDPRNHVSVMKHSWFGGEIKRDPIFYLHPFDIVGGDNPPNLFCRIWYAKPRMAYESFLNLLKFYPGNRALDETNEQAR